MLITNISKEDFENEIIRAHGKPINIAVMPSFNVPLSLHFKADACYYDSTQPDCFFAANDTGYISFNRIQSVKKITTESGDSKYTIVCGSDFYNSNLEFMIS